MRGLRGGRHGLWQGAIAHFAMIALLLRAVLFPAGCVDGAAHAAFTGNSAAVPICTVHKGGETAPLPGEPHNGSQDHAPCCSSAPCCAAAVPTPLAAFEFKAGGKPAFALEIWQTPEGATGIAPRNRGPPQTLEA